MPVQTYQQEEEGKRGKKRKELTLSPTPPPKQGYVQHTSTLTQFLIKIPVFHSKKIAVAVIAELCVVKGLLMAIHCVAGTPMTLPALQPEIRKITRVH